MTFSKALKWISRAMLGLVLVLLLATPGLARQVNLTAVSIEGEPALNLQKDDTVTPAPSAPGLGDRTEFAAFMDSLFNAEMAAREAPGAAVSVVKDGEIFFAKGYGYANVEQQIPVDAEHTLFRVASISKLFTATATMQLQEQGLLDLTDDISPYLGNRVKLENPFPEPVTFAQMLTHTDGSTKRRLGLAAPTEAKLQPLEDYLAEHLPPIVYPPGELFSYSSHSIALLGYLVQRIADQPFVDYIDEHILSPLEMNRSSFAQPPPHRQDLATGYRKRGNTFESVPYLYLNIGPGAALSSTVTDMAHFMIAQLQGGQYQNSRILQPESVADMHRIHFRSYPQLPGTGYGFRERRINGLQALGHLGSLRGYSSSLTLLPDQNIGLFIVSNSLNGVHGRVIQKFFDHYFPQESPPTGNLPEPIDVFQLNLSPFAGTYRDLEYPRHTIAKLTAPYMHINIKATESGLTVKTPALFFRNDRPDSQLEPLNPLLFRHRDDGTLTAFGADQNGNILYAYNPVLSKMATFTKIAWYENLWFHGGLLLASVLIFLSGCWIWPLHPALRSLRGKPFAVPRPHSSAWQMAGLVSTLNLIFLIGFPLSLWLYGAWKLAYGMPWFGIAFLILPITSAVLTAGMVVIALWGWITTKWSILGRLHYTVLALAATIFALLLTYWNVLGFQF
jgi:CubicO group peptidase (beta-lactamase class C family)